MRALSISLWCSESQRISRRQIAGLCLITIEEAAWTRHKSLLSETHTYQIEYFLFLVFHVLFQSFSVIFCGACSRRNEIINQMPPWHAKNAAHTKSPGDCTNWAQWWTFGTLCRLRLPEAAALVRFELRVSCWFMP